MAQAHDYNTYQIYQRYHKLNHSSRDMQNYMHFGALPRTNAPSQTEFLPEYLKAMIEGLINDINQFGDSWLLQTILSHELPAVHVLDHSAIIYVHTAIFSPEEKPKLTNKWIPFTSMYSESVGGLQFADPRAVSFTVDIRSESLLHYLAHALQLHAQKKEMQKQLTASTEEKTALNSQIAGLKDELFGLRRELEGLRNALHTDASAVAEDEKQRILDEARSEAQQIIDEANALKAEAQQQKEALEQAFSNCRTELADMTRQHEEYLENDHRNHRMLLIAQDAEMRSGIARQLKDFGAAFDQFRCDMQLKLQRWQAQAPQLDDTPIPPEGNAAPSETEAPAADGPTT